MAGKSTDQLQAGRQGLTVRLCLAVFSSALGMFTFGYNTGVINAPQQIIEEFYNASHIKRYGSNMSSGTQEFLWGFTVAVFAIGGMIGGLLGGPWADKFGRKMGMILNTVFGIAAGLLMGLSKTAWSYEMIVIGRFLIGLNCGLYTGLAPLYNAEVAPTHLRGALGVVNQLAVTVGIFLSQVFGLTDVLGGEKWWPLLIGLAGVPPLLQLLTMPLNPESPRYLLLIKKDEQQATKALMTLRGVSDPAAVRDELDEMIQEQEAEQNEDQMSVFQVLKARYLWTPLILAVVMHLSQQFSGINCIFYYSTTLFKEVGLDDDTAAYATCGVGATMIIMTLVSIPLMDNAGRRTLHLTGLCGMLIFSISFTLAFKLNTDDIEWVQIFTVVSALIIVAFFALGPGSIPWMIVAELFTQGPRAAAVSIGVVVNWLANYVVGQTFGPLQGALEELVFLPYSGALVIFIIFLYFKLPETKGKSIEEITAMFQNSSNGSSPYKTESKTGFTNPEFSDENSKQYNTFDDNTRL